jgi:hypothetical protein
MPHGEGGLPVSNCPHHKVAGQAGARCKALAIRKRPRWKRHGSYTGPRREESANVRKRTGGHRRNTERHYAPPRNGGAQDLGAWNGRTSAQQPAEAGCYGKQIAPPKRQLAQGGERRGAAGSGTAVRLKERPRSSSPTAASQTVAGGPGKFTARRWHFAQVVMEWAVGPPMGSCALDLQRLALALLLGNLLVTPWHLATPPACPCHCHH